MKSIINNDAIIGSGWMKYRNRKMGNGKGKWGNYANEAEGDVMELHSNFPARCRCGSVEPPIVPANYFRNSRKWWRPEITPTPPTAPTAPISPRPASGGRGREGGREGGGQIWEDSFKILAMKWQRRWRCCRRLSLLVECFRWNKRRTQTRRRLLDNLRYPIRDKIIRGSAPLWPTCNSSRLRSMERGHKGNNRFICIFQMDSLKSGRKEWLGKYLRAALLIDRLIGIVEMWMNYANEPIGVSCLPNISLIGPGIFSRP